MSIFIIAGGKARSTWGTESDFAELDRNMNMLKTTFIDNGIPVIIGKYGCSKHNKDEDFVRLFLTAEKHMNGKATDLHEDDMLTIFDFCLMKQILNQNIS